MVMTNPKKVVPVDASLLEAISALHGDFINVQDANTRMKWVRNRLLAAITAPPASILDDLEGLQSGWKEPQEGVYPEGAMLIQVDLASGRTDTAFVYLDDDGYTLRYADDYGDVWTAFEWEDVSRYMLLADIERQASDLNAIIEKHRGKG